MAARAAIEEAGLLLVLGASTPGSSPGLVGSLFSHADSNASARMLDVNLLTMAPP
jgi:hypothetical protein